MFKIPWYGVAWSTPFCFAYQLATAELGRVASVQVRFLSGSFVQTPCSEIAFWIRPLKPIANDRFGDFGRHVVKSLPRMQRDAATAKGKDPRSVLSTSVEFERGAAKVGVSHTSLSRPVRRRYRESPHQTWSFCAACARSAEIAATAQIPIPLCREKTGHSCQPQRERNVQGLSFGIKR